MYSRAALALVVIASALGCSLFQQHRAVIGEPPADAGYLDLTVNVKGAEVLVDDVLYGMITTAGKAQLIAIPAGTHNLTLKKFGYKDFSAKIAVEKGAANILAIDMERLPTEAVALPEEEPATQ